MTLPKNKSAIATPAVESEIPAAKAPAARRRTAHGVKTAPAAKKAAAVKQASPSNERKADATAVKKEKRVRASFSMPEAQFAALAELKARCLRLGISAKKGEVLAAGIQLLRSLPEASFEATILPHLRTDQKIKNGKMRQK